jgi:hypothetical protein
VAENTMIGSRLDSDDYVSYVFVSSFRVWCDFFHFSKYLEKKNSR